MDSGESRGEKQPEKPRRRPMNGMPLWEIFKDNPEVLEQLAADALGDPPLLQRQLARRRRLLDILSSNEQ